MIFTGPCNWDPTYGQCSDAELEIFEDLGQDMADSVKRMAVEYLWNWTGRVFGPCEITVIPCLAGCVPTKDSFWSLPYRSGWSSGLEMFGPSDVCGRRCGCNDGQMFRLPGPIVEIISVSDDGIVMSPSDYRIVNNSFVERTDGLQWPQGGMEASSTLEVTYTRGWAVPDGGKVAAGLLSLEMAKALCNDATCKLPQRVQNITRQGVSMVMLDNFDGLDAGKTGIWLVDSWVMSVIKQKAPAKVYSVDVPRVGKFRTYS